MSDTQWLHTLGDLTSQLLTAEYSDTPDDAQLLALLKQAHVMYVQVSALDAGAEPSQLVCTGPCLYLSQKPNKHVRQLVMAIRRGGDVQTPYAQLVQYIVESEEDGADGAALCAITGVPCQRNTEARIRTQLVHEAARVLKYAQGLVKSRVFELEAQAELATTLHGGASMKTLVKEFGEGNQTKLVPALFTCLPCDESLRQQVMADVSSVDAVLRPVVNTIPYRMRPQAALVKHAFAKRWEKAASSQ